MKMSDVFELPLSIMGMEIDENDTPYSLESSDEEDRAAETAINNHDTLLEALEWALELAEAEVDEAALPMDQIKLIKYQALLQELK